MVVDVTLPLRILWSDEAQFCLDSSSGIANSDEEKANLLALTLKHNFIGNKRPGGKIYPIDDNIPSRCSY
ncbi:hypothetical protein TNCV_2695511 [Trichonephila clavipes]|nr:hypothetical protein TNCV_2695511 [Trichonephila clavipes]